METVDFGASKQYDGTAKEKILQLLIDAPFSMRKETIAERLGMTVPYVARTLSELTRADLVYESKGNYVAKCKVIPDSHEIASLTVKPKEDGISISINWERVKVDPNCRYITDNQEEVKHFGFKDVLLPIVLHWLVLTGHKLPTFTNPTDEFKDDEKIQSALNTFYDNIFRIYNKD